MVTINIVKPWRINGVLSGKPCCKYCRVDGMQAFLNRATGSGWEVAKLPPILIGAEMEEYYGIN